MLTVLAGRGLWGRFSVLLSSIRSSPGVVVLVFPRPPRAAHNKKNNVPKVNITKKIDYDKVNNVVKGEIIASSTVYSNKNLSRELGN